MKRLAVAALFLLLILVSSLCHVHYLGRFTGEISALLAEAQTAAEGGDWAKAEAITLEALDRWEKQISYLHVTLIHHDADEININFREVLEYISQQENGEYSAANARLITRLELLYEMEQLILRNIL